MTTADELRCIVERWAHEPDHGRIRHVLTTSEDRHHLAAMCIDADLSLPEDLADLVLELIDTDPLMELVLDTLLDHAFNSTAVDPTVLPTLARLILDRPDSPAFQRILADTLVDILFDEQTDTPTHVKDHLADLSSMLATALPEPAFAPVFLAHALTRPEPEVSSRALRLCWERAVRLPDDLLFPIAVDVTDMVDVDTDHHLAVQAARTALRLAPEHEPPDTDPEQTANLHWVLVEGMARTDRPAAIQYAETAMSQAPDLESSLVAESWATTLLAHIVDLALRDVPPAQVLPFADRLAAHPHRWPDEQEASAYFSVVLARVYLAGNEPERARRWVDLAFEQQQPADLPDYRAEVAMLKAHVAFNLGRTEEIGPLLRDAAQAVTEASDDEYRLAWGAITEAVARVNRDHTLTQLSRQSQAGIVEDLTETTAGYQPDRLRAHYAFGRELMDLHERFLADGNTPDNRDTAVALCREVPDDQPQLFIGAHMYACVLEYGQENMDEAYRHLDELGKEIRRQRSAPGGGFPIVVAEQMERFFRLLMVRNIAEWSDERTDRLRRLRNENEAAGRSQVAYTLTRCLMLIHTMSGDHAAATDEGIRALSFHTRRVVTTPDARERAVLREDFNDLAGATFQAASAAGWPQVAAEILEVIRAQPVPVARAEVPRTEQSLMGLAVELLTETQPAQWDGTWAASGEAALADGCPARSHVEETSLLMTGLPSILMPWGPALQDRLSDPNSPGAVQVVVPREDPGG